MSPYDAVQLSLQDHTKKCRVGAGERVVRAHTFWNAMRTASLQLRLEAERSAARTDWNVLASLRISRFLCLVGVDVSVGMSVGIDPGSERGAGGDDKLEVQEKGRGKARTVLALLLCVVELSRCVFIFAEQLATVASKGGK